jgi:microcystin-dependent protein
MGDEGMIGEIRLFAGNFAPRNWAFCDGSLQSIAQNTALFSILGTTYGGDGITTFALPDLQGRAAVGVGTGPGLQAWDLGEVQGTETNTMTTNQMPAHTHTVMANNTPGAGDQNTPSNNYMAAGPVDRSSGLPVNTRYASTTDGTHMGPQAIGTTGGSLPFNNMQPSLCLNYIICLYGIFPSRN